MSRLDATLSSSYEEDKMMNGLDTAPSYEENQEERRLIFGRSFDVSFDSHQNFQHNRAFHPEKGLIATEIKVAEEQKQRSKPNRNRGPPSKMTMARQ